MSTNPQASEPVDARLLCPGKQEAEAINTAQLCHLHEL